MEWYLENSLVSEWFLNESSPDPESLSTAFVMKYVGTLHSLAFLMK